MGDVLICCFAGVLMGWGLVKGLFLGGNKFYRGE
jgi:hypothetical protein